MELYKYTEKEKDLILQSMVVMVDTREQLNDHILKSFDRNKVNYERTKVDFGDYSFFVPQNNSLGITRDWHFQKKITIERKRSLEELSANFTNDRERFEKELSTYGGKMHLIIENSNYSDVLEGNYGTKYKSNSYIASIHSFQDRYNLQMIFLPRQEYSGAYISSTLYYFLKNTLK